MKKLAILALALLVAGCTDGDKTIRAVEAMGLRDVTVTGYRVFGCSDDDDFHTGFEATNPAGQRVTGVVCSGFLKGATVRMD